MNKRPARIRVLVVDDSASVRQTMKAILEEDPELEVIGTAADPFAAARIIQTEVPDVITLDVEMPRMDGITFLRKLMSQCPVPVVMCSSLTEQGSETLLQALERQTRRARKMAEDAIEQITHSSFETYHDYREALTELEGVIVLIEVTT